MTEEIFNKKIGDKEVKPLDAKPVDILGFVVESVTGKKGTKNAEREVGKKLVLLCKHPDKDEQIKISSITSIVNKSLKSMTLWVNLDEDDNIQKGSTIAILLNHFKVGMIKDLEGKKVDTELDESKFLTIKAY